MEKDERLRLKLSVAEILARVMARQPERQYGATYVAECVAGALRLAGMFGVHDLNEEQLVELTNEIVEEILAVRTAQKAAQEKTND